MNNLEDKIELQYQEALNNFHYPKGVESEADYDKFLNLSNQWKNHASRQYTFKFKKGLSLDLAQSPSEISTFLDQHKVPKSEADLVIKLNLEIYSLALKATYYKKIAFGDSKITLTEDGLLIPDEISYATPIAIDLFGRFFKVEEVHQSLHEDFEVTSLSIPQLNRIYKDNLTKIKGLQEKFKAEYSDCRLGYKRSRIEELQFLYNNRRNIYTTSKSREDEKQLQSLLESIKREVDGDLVINGNLNVQIESQVNVVIQNEIMKDLNISMFVISKIAGKHNLNPTLLLSRLANSRYSQFSGFSDRGLSSTAMTDEISYPSNILYNWDSIRNSNEIKIQEETKLGRLPEIKDSSGDNIESLKQRLLRKIEEANKPLQASKEIIQ